MAEGNGGFDWQQNLRDLNEAARMNLDEHEGIWKSIAGLRDSQLASGKLAHNRLASRGQVRRVPLLFGADGLCAINEQVASLVGAIRDLIDRIPPVNLR